MPLNKNSKLLAEKISSLKDNSGTLILSIGDYYVQFARNKNTSVIYFEAVSHYFLDTLPTNLIFDFVKLGFELIKGENYSKTIRDDEWKTIITDVQEIFQNIYKVNYEKDFEVIDDIEYPQASTNSKTNLPVNRTIQELQKPSTENPTNWKAIFLIVGALLFFYFSFVHDSEKNKNSTSENYTDSYFENSPESQLALINDHTKQPQEITVSQFNNLLISISQSYSNITKQKIANCLVSAHIIIVKNGRGESLLEFTTGFDTFSKELDPIYNLKIEESLALFVKTAY